MHTTQVEDPYDVDNETVCYSCRAMAMRRRVDEKEHEEEEKRKGASEAHFADGRIYTVRPMTWEQYEEETGAQRPLRYLQE